MEELSIEEKAKRYDKAIKIAKALNSSKRVAVESGTTVYECIFPEIKESEDERIRERILAGLIDCRDTHDLGWSDFGGIPIDDCIAWLEKQGEVDKTHYDIAEKEKYDFVSGQYIECRKSFDVFKEDNSYWFEYIGNDNYIGRSDNIINQKFHITPKQLFCLFTQQYCPKENNVNEETNAPTEYCKYVDEYLMEVAKHFFSEGKDKYTVADLFYAGIKCKEDWLKKKREKKQEWSEDDENEFNHIIHILNLVEEEQEIKGYNNLIGTVDWFKSLKDKIVKYKR